MNKYHAIQNLDFKPLMWELDRVDVGSTNNKPLSSQDAGLLFGGLIVG
jgi:hypothetical protein